jgi:hypothetical protein
VHQLDPNDPAWHLDGTPHIDHDHLIFGITARMSDGSALPAGATPAFDLRMTSETLFHAGFVGLEKAEVKDSALVDSFDPRTNTFGAQGDVVSDREVSIRGLATVTGLVTGERVRLETRARIGGSFLSARSLNLMSVALPANLPALGEIELKATGQTIVGPGSFYVEKMKLEDGARLFVDNSAGPVTLYVTGDIVLAGGSTITVADRSAEKFAIYSVGDRPVILSGTGTSMVGVVYAPRSPITLSGDVEFTGAFVGKELKAEKTARVHYDRSLRAR